MHSDALAHSSPHRTFTIFPLCRVSFLGAGFPFHLKCFLYVASNQRFPVWWRVFFPSWELLPSSTWPGFLSFCRVSIHIPIDQSFLSLNICPLGVSFHILFWSRFIRVWRVSYTIFHLSEFPWLVQDFPSFLRVFIHLPIDQGILSKCRVSIPSSEFPSIHLPIDLGFLS